MADFLEVTLTKSLEFRCDFKSEIYGIYGESTFYPSIRQSGIKIDTGAHWIIIPLRTLGWTDTQIQKILDDAILYSRQSLSVLNGVESVNNISSVQLRNESDNFIKSYPGVAITISADKIVVGNLEFNDVPVRVTPFTTGNILLGMEIIKMMDNHIGTSKATGETTLLVCPEDSISNEYLGALNKHFGLGRI